MTRVFSLRPLSCCWITLVCSLLVLTSPLMAGGLPSISGLQVQLTADLGTSTTSDGADVADWFDQAHNHLFFNANDTLPTYVANSGGGVPAIDFTRSSGFLGDFSGSAGSVIGDATIFVVARFDGYEHGSGSSSYFFSIDTFGDPPNNSEHTLGRDANGPSADALYHWRGQPSPQSAYGTNIIEDRPGGFGDFNYFTSIFRESDDGGGAVNEFEAWINGSNGGAATPDASLNGSGYSASPSETRIGLWTSGGSGLDGMIREILIYNRVLTSQEITDVEAYLAARSLSPEPPTMLLEIDRGTRAVSLKNVSGATLNLAGYSATSASGALDRTAWTSIAENYDSDSGGSVDPTNIWQELGSASDPSLVEEASSGFATLAANQSIALGAAWVPYVQEDLRLEFTDDLGESIIAEVQFSGNGGQAFEFGDLNFNGTFGLDDWTTLINVYGSDLTGATLASAYGLGDLDGNGRHSLADIQTFRTAFAAAGGDVALLVGAPVPEPTTLALAMLAGCLPMLRRRPTPAMVRCHPRTAVSLALVALVAAAASSTAQAGLFDDVALSADAQSKFLIHFDATVGVSTSGANVTSWAGMDGTGTSTVATASIAGAGSPANITSNGSAIVFSETNAADSLHLSTPLTTSGDQYTIVWVGHYDSSDQNGAANSGLYAYSLTNLDVSNAPGMNHQRDNSGDSFIVEVYPGSTFGGDDIAGFDDTTTVWSTIYDYANGSHSTFVQDTNLNLTGSSNLSLNANPTLVIGGYDDGSYFNGSGYNILGEMEQLIIFDGVVSLGDIASIVSFYGDPLPTLRVNLENGELSLSGGSEARDINGYEILSPGGSLNGASWASSNLDAQGVDSSGEGVGESWDTFAASDSQLTEAYLSGSSAFDTNRTESLGIGYNTGVDARDLTFEYTVADGRTLFGAIEYFGTPGVDPDGDGDWDGADFLIDQREGNVAEWQMKFGTGVPASAAANAVPEPMSSALFGLGLGGIALVGRRRARNRVR